jgi:CIC family chloride channel protein
MVGLLRRLGRSFRARLHEIFDLESAGRLVVYSAIVGVLAGLGAAGFNFAVNAVEQVLLGDVIGYYQPAAGTDPLNHRPQLPANCWALVLIPTLGGLACGLVVWRFAPEAGGHGTDAVIRAFHSQRGLIRARVPLVKGIASALTIGTGGSAGREGPICQIGAGCGAVLAKWLRLNDWERRMLILAGMAGGLGAIFRVPLGGALFSVEVLYATTAFEFSAIIPCVVSSVVAYSVFIAIFGPGLAFNSQSALMFRGAWELVFYLGLAVLCALVGYVYIAMFYGVKQRLFDRLAIPRYLKPALGGLLVGIVAFEYPQVMAGGYGWMQEAILHHLTFQVMAMLVIAKMVATSLTISSGGSGGLFAPSLFIGAMLGGAYGLLCESAFGHLAPQPAAMVLVGMGGLLAGVAKIPLASLIMVSEMSGTYNLLVPLMLVNVIVVAILSSRVTLFKEQVQSLIDSPAHLGDFVVDVLEDIRVRDIYRPSRCPVLIRENMPLRKVLGIVAESSENCFPVVDGRDRLVGIFSLHDIRSTLLGNEGGGLILASDLARSPVLTLTPDDNLHTALRYYAQKQIEEIPVVDPQDSARVICMLRRGEVIAAYDERMALLHEPEERLSA